MFQAYGVQISAKAVEGGAKAGAFTLKELYSGTYSRMPVVLPRLSSAEHGSSQFGQAKLSHSQKSWLEPNLVPNRKR